MKRLVINKGKKQKNILDTQPYKEFIEKYEKMDDSDDTISMRIVSQKSNSSFFSNGFYLDYIYSNCFDLFFSFATLVDEKNVKKHIIYHELSFKYDSSYQDMMKELTQNINNRNGYYYISSLCQECQLEAYLNSSNMVTVAFNVSCEKKSDYKEICLELLSLDIALFTRSF